MTFDHETFDKDKKSKVFSYYPDAQFVLRASLEEDVYEYVKFECSEDERKKFVAEAVCLEMYGVDETSCCLQALKSGGPNALQSHCFGVLRESADFNAVKENKIRQSGKQPMIVTVEKVPVIYGSGIQLDRRHSYQICESFSMSRMGTVLDLVKERHDGLAYPYIYVGTQHSLFPWHIEDAGLWSINYLFHGATKMWFGISPQYFGLMDKIVSCTNISPGHKSCCAVLVDHKTLVADSQYFFKQHGVPYTMVLQKPGDFVITFPFALHSGFNVGRNLAMAGNFGDPEWIPGIHTPICSCYDKQIHLNFTEILKSCRPDLLNSYLNCTATIFPPGHPLDQLDPSRPTSADDVIVRAEIPAVWASKNKLTSTSTFKSRGNVVESADDVIVRAKIPAVRASKNKLTSTSTSVERKCG